MQAILQDIVEDDQRACEVISRLRGLLKRGPLERAALDLNEITREVARLVRGDAVARGVSIRLDLAPGLPLVQGDRVELQQVLLNLILNGLDAMRQTSAEERVLVLQTVPEGAGGVRVIVRDTGSGIDPDKLDRVFEAFHTTKPAGPRDGSGDRALHRRGARRAAPGREQPGARRGVHLRVAGGGTEPA